MGRKQTGEDSKKYIKIKLQFWRKFKASLYTIMPKNREIM
jgi:hypothetical protein